MYDIMTAVDHDWYVQIEGLHDGFDHIRLGGRRVTQKCTAIATPIATTAKGALAEPANW